MTQVVTDVLYNVKTRHVVCYQLQQVATNVKKFQAFSKTKIGDRRVNGPF
jgi:hypothetical protein